MTQTDSPFVLYTYYGFSFENNYFILWENIIQYYASSYVSKYGAVSVELKESYQLTKG